MEEQKYHWIYKRQNGEEHPETEIQGTGDSRTRKNRTSGISPNAGSQGRARRASNGKGVIKGAQKVTEGGTQIIHRRYIALAPLRPEREKKISRKHQSVT